MIQEQKLRQGLQKLLEGTITAIRERLTDEPSLEAKLRERHAAAVQAARTEGSAKGYTAFADDQITQAAVHWLLGCVFVRFLEDNGWLDERNTQVAWIAGPDERLALARGRRTLFLRPDPGLTDRDYVLHVFGEVAKLPGVSGLFDAKHNPLYVLQPTAQGAARIVEFFQRVDPDTNALVHDFTDPAHGTRFLGDLYQNLSESARKRYALCQTPGFVIDFILDRTLTPALDAFGLATVRMIDPSCGSGHFLLEAYARLVRAWGNKEPGTNMPALVQRALDAVYGVDLNPFAVEITRFRLLIAALESSRIGSLNDAPSFKFSLAAGDSLLHGDRLAGGGIQRGLLEDHMEHFYDTEDAEELKRILSQPYHVVVGNPPYINVSDPVLREAYRSRYETCHGQYQLSVPFTERFFDLSLERLETSVQTCGWIGMIASSAFMKRVFGRKLIEQYLHRKDLTHVIDTSVVYLPGHGTPTTILLARNRVPTGSRIRAIRGIKGENEVPEEPAQGKAWREIVDHIDEIEFEGYFVSVADAPRESFASFPWTTSGGGAAELKLKIDNKKSKLADGQRANIGGGVRINEDDAFIVEPHRAARLELPSNSLRPFIDGASVRDWDCTATDLVLFPYGDDSFPRLADQLLWRWRETLRRRVTFSGTMASSGLNWWDYQQFTPFPYASPFSITFSNVATHNHFVLDRGGKVFDSHAPVVKLSQTAKELDYVELLGILNASIACFWLKQVCFPKGGDHIGTEGARVTKNRWEERFEFDTTKLRQFPVPNKKPAQVTELIQTEAELRAKLLPDQLSVTHLSSRDLLDSACGHAQQHLGRMIALQEELDWQCYKLYGIVDEELTVPSYQIPNLNLGERAFEMLLARNEEEPLWFERHGSTPTKDLPTSWPEPYRKLVEKRIALIKSNRDIGLIERPEYKRRWNLSTWQEMETAALKSWLLDRIEAHPIWKEHRLLSCSQLRDLLSQDREWIAVADIYNGTPVEDLQGVVTRLALPESVPFLPVLRYTEYGLRKRAEWEEVWRLQRLEDGGATNLNIPIPPKYVVKDFWSVDYWRLRGGLDVPKERFLLFPGLERDADRTAVLGWAGWNHLEQAQALAAYYQKMRTEEGWAKVRLKPILAGLLDLRQWLKQWHDQVDPETGLQLGTFFSEFAEAQCQELGFSTQELLAWQPAATTRRRERRTRTQ